MYTTGATATSASDPTIEAVVLNYLKDKSELTEMDFVRWIGANNLCKHKAITALLNVAAEYAALLDNGYVSRPIDASTGKVMYLKPVAQSQIPQAPKTYQAAAAQVTTTPAAPVTMPATSQLSPQVLKRIQALQKAAAKAQQEAQKEAQKAQQQQQKAQQQAQKAQQKQQQAQQMQQAAQQVAQQAVKQQQLAQQPQQLPPQVLKELQALQGQQSPGQTSGFGWFIDRKV